MGCGVHLHLHHERNIVVRWLLETDVEKSAGRFASFAIVSTATQFIEFCVCLRLPLMGPVRSAPIERSVVRQDLARCMLQFGKPTHRQHLTTFAASIPRVALRVSTTSLA